MSASFPESTTSVKLDAELHDRLHRLADARRQTPHGLMREAIAQYVVREEGRDSLREDALAAWDEYQTTGQHVTGAAVDAWLAQLEEGKEAEPPACRP